MKVVLETFILSVLLKCAAYTQAVRLMNIYPFDTEMITAIQDSDLLSECRRVAFYAQRWRSNVSVEAHVLACSSER